MFILLVILFSIAVLIIVLMTCALGLGLYGGLVTGVPFIPAPRPVADALATLAPLKASDVFYDLGCGDGRYVIDMARRYPAATCIGVEKAPLPALLAYVRLRLAHLPNAKILYTDFSKISVSNATHIFTYLLPFVMDKVLPKLEKDLKPGTRLVSCDFKFKNRTASSVVPLPPSSHRLYVYEFY